MEDIMKIVKSLKGSGVFMKDVTKTIENILKERRNRFFWYVINYIRCKCMKKCFSRQRLEYLDVGRILNSATSFD